MVYIVFPPEMTIDECEKEYRKVASCLPLREMISQCLGVKSIVKNGTRKKVYRDKGEKHVFRIQRMASDCGIYFDFFPLFLMPDSVSPFEEITEYENGKRRLFHKCRKNRFQKWMESEGVDFLTPCGFLPVGNPGRGFLLYQSIHAVTPYFSRKGRHEKRACCRILAVFVSHQHI